MSCICETTVQLTPLHRICHSPNGWIDSELALSWFTKDFLPEVKANSGDEPIGVFLDSQVTHLSLELLEAAAENKVEFLAYPTRCTHALQGLDVVCFARMKDVYQEEVKKFTEEHRRKVAKADFAGVFGAAFIRAFTKENILAAFRATGIHPFNPSVITPSQMKPSEPASLQGSFPVEQSSPVKAIMKAFRDAPLTRFDIEACADFEAPKEGVVQSEQELRTHDQQDIPHCRQLPPRLLSHRNEPLAVRSLEKGCESLH